MQARLPQLSFSRYRLQPREHYFGALLHHGSRVLYIIRHALCLIHRLLYDISRVLCVIRHALYDISRALCIIHRLLYDIRALTQYLREALKYLQGATCVISAVNSKRQAHLPAPRPLKPCQRPVWPCKSRWRYRFTDNSPPPAGGFYGHLPRQVFSLFLLFIKNKYYV